MSTPDETPRAGRGRGRAPSGEHDVLEAFNAEGVVEHPGEPEDEPSPAGEADAPAPPG